MDLQNIHLLVVDDSKTFNNIMNNTFIEFGYKVSKAYTLQEAKDILLSQTIDYVLLDLNLPDGSGVELIDIVKEISTSKIIVMTGNEDIEFRDEAFRKGIIDYFIKTTPIKIIVNCTNKLIQTIEMHKNTNILTIDDSTFVRKFLKNILEAKGYNVYEAASAIEAKKILQDHPIHLILLDLIMPEIDGMQFLENIKADKHYFDIPVIVISGDSSRANYSRVLKQGVVDFIKKPFIIEEILLKCDIHLKSYLNQEKLLNQQSIILSNREELHKKNIYHRNLMEINLDPLVTISSDGKITDVNQATIEATGVSREDLIDSDFSSYFTHPKQAQLGYEKVLKEGKVVDYPLELENRDGRVMDVICNGSTYKDENGNITGVFVAARDVTEINNLRKTAEEVNKLKSMSKLLENIAHQWRQPLSVISTSVSAIKVSLEFGLVSEDTFMKNIDKAVEYTQSLSKTIDNFQMLFQNDLVKQQIEMQHLIDTVLVNYQDYIQKNNITLIQKIDNFSIEVYEHELTQIISGLLNNIVEHGKNNELIFITATTDTDNAIIKIKDSGGGVGDEILNSIFEAYFTTEHQFMGKGIGLYFVYQLIRRHFNGTVTAHNTTYTYNNTFYKGLEIIIKIPITQ